MARREVLRLPHPVLKRRAQEVDPADPDVVRLAADLADTMRASPACVGLAAPQVGVALRVVCVDVSGHPKAVSQHGLLVLANPEVVAAGPAQLAREGCMSVPDFTGDVARPVHVVLRGVVPGTGATRVVDADAFEARALLHEIDHLDGLLFLDRVASGRRDVFPRKRYK